MRILLATDQYPPMLGGVPTVSRSLALGLAERGHQVWILAPSSDASDYCECEAGVTIHRFGSFEWPWYSGQRIACPSQHVLDEILTRVRPEIIHLQSPLTLGLQAQRAAHRLGIPVIATNHYLPENLNQTLAANRQFASAFYACLNQVYRRCHYVTAPTHFALNLLHANGLRTPSAVISNGIDLQKYTPEVQDCRQRRAFHLPEDRPLILHVNRLSAEKRIDVILRALPGMRVPAHLALVGSGPERPALETLCEHLRLQDRVSFLGRLPDADLQSLWHAADLAVIASEAELQSLSTMEAMACGLPVVAADAKALPELVRNGRNGLLFAPGDTQALAANLDRLCLDPAYRRQLGRESRTLILAHDRSQVLSDWESLYEGLCQERWRRQPRWSEPIQPLPAGAVDYGSLVFSRAKPLSRESERLP